jgi:hypothetical protein
MVWLYVHFFSSQSGKQILLHVSERCPRNLVLNELTRQKMHCPEFHLVKVLS